MTMIRCQVILLDDSIKEWNLEKKAVGQVLFDHVCEYLNLLERDYFGLAAWDSSNNKVWLDLSRQVHKQMISHEASFTFSVKFYPPDPSVLTEDITRYLLCLQLRTDILTSRLPCPSDMLAVLGSYAIQAEFGDYNPELHGREFFSKIPLAPNQTPELEEKVAELHRTLKSMSPDEADQLFLQNVKTLRMYGVHLHPAKDASGGEVMLGVCADGLMVFQDEEKTQDFIWPRVMNMSYKHSTFLATIQGSEDATEHTIKFILPSYRACKCLWRNAVDHHAFFRNIRNVDQSPARLLHLGSRFRFQGHTHAESLEASSNIKRPAPSFSRSAIKRKDESDILTDVDNLTGGETFAYEKREKVDDLSNERLQMLRGRSFHTQHTQSSLSSGTDILESDKFQVWKPQADDWFVLLEPSTHQPTYQQPMKTIHLSSQPEERREELELIERTSEKNIKVVKIIKELEAVIEQHGELEMESGLMRPDVVGESLKLDSGASEQIMKVMREKIERDGGDEELQTVVVYEERTREVVPRIERSQQGFIEQRMKGMEAVDTVHEVMLKTGQVVSDESIQELEERLLDVESIEQRLQDIERLKGKLQEVEILEQMLQHVQQAVRQQGVSDDWYILLEHKLREFSAPASQLDVETSEQKLLLDRNPTVVSSARADSTMETEAELQKTNTLTSVEMNDDWHILLGRKPTLPPSELDIQSSVVHVVEGHASMADEKQWREEKTMNVRETQTTFPAPTEQTQKQVDRDWLIQQDISLKEAGPNMDTEEEKAMIRQWLKTDLQRGATLTPVQMEDDWYIMLEMLPQSSQTIQPALPPSEEHKNLAEEEQWREERAIYVRETQSALSAQTVEQTLKQVDEGWWFIQQDVSAKEAALTMDTEDEKVKIKQLLKMGLQSGTTPTPVQMKDDWYILLEKLPHSTKTIQHALPPSVFATGVDVYKDQDIQLVKKEVEMTTFEEERRQMIETSHEVLQMNPVPSEKRDVPSVTFDKKPMIFKEKHVLEERVDKKIPAIRREDEDWFVLFTPAQIEKKVIITGAETLRPQQTVTIKEKEITVDTKPMIVREKQVIIGEVDKKIPATRREDDDWFLLFTPAQIERKTIDTAGVSDTWILKERRLMDVQKEVKTSHAVEDRRLHAHVPGLKAEERQWGLIDDWSVLLEPVSKKTVIADRRALEEQRRKEELLKKRVMAEDKRRVAADQPMTSTPTAQSIRITRPTYQEESLKGLHITQEITQDMKEESTVETESVVMRKKREKRVNGESIYIRHSLLMLEDSDVTQEVVLKHYASISQLKRIFMEDIPVYGPTEWDRRLSSYTPVVYPKLSNGELFTSIDIMGADGLLVM